MNTDAIALRGSRPAPQPDAASAPFFEALKQRRLLLQRCARCGTNQLGQRRCLACHGDDLVWQPASGQASLYACAEVHANPAADFNGGAPYNIAIVELAEGPQLYANVVNAPMAGLRIGMPLRVVYAELVEGWVVPVFEPAEAFNPQTRGAGRPAP